MEYGYVTDPSGHNGRYTYYQSTTLGYVDQSGRPCVPAR